MRIANKQIVNDFISSRNKIVIGNVTSSMSKISMSIINQHKDMFYDFCSINE